jgi:DNA-binding response OmpR family regulator
MPRAASSKAEPAFLPPRPLRIVVADDDRDAVLMLKTLLRDEGHVVEGVYSGDAVMPLVAKLEPDVVILDISMPGASGYTVAREIAESSVSGRAPMVIAITGKYTSASDRMLSAIVGFDHYLLKPYAPQDLLNLLEQRKRELRILASPPTPAPRKLN